MARKKNRTYAGAPVGSGKNFEKLSRDLAAKGVENPEGLAAAIGRKKYGKARFQKMAAAARRRKS